MPPSGWDLSLRAFQSETNAARNISSINIFMQLERAASRNIINSTQDALLHLRSRNSNTFKSNLIEICTQIFNEPWKINHIDQHFN